MTREARALYIAKLESDISRSRAEHEEMLARHKAAQGQIIAITQAACFKIMADAMTPTSRPASFVA